MGLLSLTTGQEQGPLPWLRHDRYWLIREIGQLPIPRTYSQVFLAGDLSTGQTVVIKYMKRALSGRQKALAHAFFVREAAMLGVIRHQHIVRLLDTFEEDGQHVLVLEHIDGETLDGYPQAAASLLLHPTAPVQARCFSLCHLVAIGMQLCDALEYLHTRTPPIIHRDLKPANVLIRPDGHVTLIDFGLARYASAAGHSKVFFRPSVARPDTIGNMGSWGYAAPEQYGEEARTTPLSDIYSLGALLHWMVSGEDPSLKSQDALFDFPYLTQAPRKLATVIASMTQHNPTQRSPSIAAVREQLVTCSRPAMAL